MKTCSRCDIPLPSLAFSKDARKSDGLQSHCKACRRARYLANRESEMAYSKQYATENRVSVLSYKRAYAAANRDELREKRRNYSILANTRVYNDDPQKRYARNVLKAAVRYGRIEKPTTCEDCLQPFPKAQIHGHHEDYSKPLDVNWLCAPCHGRRHRVALEGVAA